MIDERKELLRLYGQLIDSEQYQLACGVMLAVQFYDELGSRTNKYMAKYTGTNDEIITDQGALKTVQSSFIASDDYFTDEDGDFQEDADGFGLEIFFMGQWYRVCNIDFD